MPGFLVRKAIAALTAGLALAVSLGVPASAHDDSIVRTAAGSVRGTVTPDHRAFLGIPYAAPPVGERRWRSPQPAEPWTGVRDAIRQGAVCPQPGGYFPGDPPVLGSEDCLFLNVETPRTAAGLLPVMVFVHGGGLVGGNGGTYDPTRVTDQGVVVVTLNYRLGALGFLLHPDLRDRNAGNLGLADQQAALRWVRHNIAAFGGDPGNVTLWGESAGAFSTCAQLASPAARGLFHKAIVQSGPCSNAVLTRPVARRRALAIAAEVGCPDPRTAADCLRGKPFQDLTGLRTEEAAELNRELTGHPWLPVTGTPTLPLQPSTAIRRGLAADVPLIHGGTRDEMRAHVAGRYAQSPLTAARYPEVVRELYGDRAARVLARYPASAYPTPADALATLLTDEGRFVGACAQLALFDTVSRRAPVYSYEFAEPSGRVVGGMPLLAAHGADIPYFFGSRFPGAPPPPTGEKLELATTLIGHWTSFARTGTPGPDWPAYTGNGVVPSFSIDRIAPVDLGRTPPVRLLEHHPLTHPLCVLRIVAYDLGSAGGKRACSPSAIGE